MLVFFLVARTPKLLDEPADNFPYPRLGSIRSHGDSMKDTDPIT